MSSSDDEDWLYRRGRYGADASSVGRSHGPDARPDTVGTDGDPLPSAWERRPSRPPEPAPVAQPEPPRVETRLGAPTPVGHYGPAQPDRTRPAPGRRSGRASTGSAPARPRRRRPAGLLRLALLALVLYLVGIPLWALFLVPKVDASPDRARPADTPGHVIVLAGSDSREGLSTEEQNRLGTGSDAGRRTDTIMLLYVPPMGRATLLSIPRDSFVPIPGQGKNKINAAYSYGGPELLVAAIEQNTGLRVDGYTEIGFGGFAGVVDALGGIQMCPASAIKDRDSNLDIPAGCQTMDGATALGYVRMRKADPEGDLGRARRQREMVSALVKKTVSPLTVLLPPRWWGVNMAMSRGLTLGADNGIGESLALASAGLRIATGQSDTLVVPIGNPDAHTAVGSAVLWDAKKAPALFDAMKRGEGDLREYVK